MTPEAKARQQIDQKLEQADWVIQDMKQLNLAAGVGIAVRENLTVTENQTERYATANLKWRKDNIVEVEKLDKPGSRAGSNRPGAYA
jgi:type I restriction enzyme, R subunit